MPREPNHRPSSETLSVGNVVSAGLRIYRDNFKVYYLEALKSYLWIFFPWFTLFAIILLIVYLKLNTGIIVFSIFLAIYPFFYSSAKFAAIQAVIARLAFCEVSEMPESLSDARRQIMPKMWIFLVTGILQGLIVMAGFIVFGIMFGIIFALLIFNIQSNTSVSAVFVLLIVLLYFLLIFAFIWLIIWLISRIAFADLAIAIDDIREATRAIGRSWTITQGFVAKIQIIFFIAYLLTIPLSAISNLGSFFFKNSEFELLLLGVFLNLILAIPLGALLIPFWQSIKAVIYYDLLTRKEGLGLELRDVTDNF
jgi:hypothetical protein